MKRTHVFFLALLVMVAATTTTTATVSYAEATAHAISVGEYKSFEELLSFSEFRELAERLSHKVNLFRDTWAEDSSAEFFAGTTRDYLYWVRGQFRDAKTRQQVDEVIARLDALTQIDIRSFVAGDSDTDIVTGANSLPLDASHYGVTKIDFINRDRFDPTTEAGQNEIKQGYIPVEKIRLGKYGFVSWRNFDGGVNEIYLARPTVYFTSDQDFSETYYAKNKLNHKILLALRWLRVSAVNYFYQYGQGYPDLGQLYASLDPQSSRAVREVISGTIDEGRLRDFLAQPNFKKWINGTILKTFRSHTSPTASYELYKYFKADQLITQYANQLEPINKYLFAKPRNAEQIQLNLATYGIRNPELLYVDASRVLPDLKLYHGTANEDTFLAMLLEGVLPSSGGKAGAGLYGVDMRNIKFATERGGSLDRIVSLKLKPGAKVVDITQGRGLELFRQFGGDHDKFADAFGIDVLIYPWAYSGSYAYVIKNGAVLENVTGHTRNILTITEFNQKMSEAKSYLELVEIYKSVSLSRFTTAEITNAAKTSSLPNISTIVAEFNANWSYAYPAALRGQAFSIIMQVEALKELAAKNLRKDDPVLNQIKRALTKNLDSFSESIGLSAVENSKMAEMVATSMARVMINNRSSAGDEMVSEILQARFVRFPALRRVLTTAKVWYSPLTALPLLFLPAVADYYMFPGPFNVMTLLPTLAGPFVFIHSLKHYTKQFYNPKAVIEDLAVGTNSKVRNKLARQVKKQIRAKRNGKLEDLVEKEQVIMRSEEEIRRALSGAWQREALPSSMLDGAVEILVDVEKLKANPDDKLGQDRVVDSLDLFYDNVAWKTGNDFLAGRRAAIALAQAMQDESKAGQKVVREILDERLARYPLLRNYIIGVARMLGPVSLAVTGYLVVYPLTKSLLEGHGVPSDMFPRVAADILMSLMTTAAFNAKNFQSVAFKHFKHLPGKVSMARAMVRESKLLSKLRAKICNTDISALAP